MSITTRGLTIVAALAAVIPLLAIVAAAPSRLAGVVPVEDWSSQPPDKHGVPAGWQPYATIGGRPAYDFAVVEDDGRRALRIQSQNEHSTIARSLTVDLKATPILEWSWKVTRLPEGADVRRRSTSDLAAQI